MKTLELKLKKDVLIADAENGFKLFKIYDDEIGFISIENGMPIKELIKGSYKFLCKGSGLTEEIASELCHNIGNSLTIIGNAYLDDVNDLYFWEYAIDAFITSVESKDFYWLKNPYKKDVKQWQEAEEKTFKNPLIFVKK